MWLPNIMMSNPLQPASLLDTLHDSCKALFLMDRWVQADSDSLICSGLPLCVQVLSEAAACCCANVLKSQLLPYASHLAQGYGLPATAEVPVFARKLL